MFTFPILSLESVISLSPGSFSGERYETKIGALSVLIANGMSLPLAVSEERVEHVYIYIHKHTHIPTNIHVINT